MYSPYVFVLNFNLTFLFVTLEVIMIHLFFIVISLVYYVNNKKYLAFLLVCKKYENLIYFMQF